MRAHRDFPAPAFGLACCVLAVACGTTDPPDFACLNPGPDIGDRQAQVSGGYWNMDDEYAAIAREIPGGFGGLFLNQYQGRGVQNKYNIYLVQPGQSEAAVAALIPRLAAWQSTWPLPLTPSNFNALQGDFDYAQLKSCYQLVQSTGISGMVSTDIDEGLNRIVIGVDSDATQQRALAELQRRGVPPQMLVARTEGPVEVWP